MLHILVEKSMSVRAWPEFWPSLSCWYSSHCRQPLLNSHKSREAAVIAAQHQQRLPLFLSRQSASVGFCARSIRLQHNKIIPDLCVSLGLHVPLCIQTMCLLFQHHYRHLPICGKRNLQSSIVPDQYCTDCSVNAIKYICIGVHPIYVMASISSTDTGVGSEACKPRLAQLANPGWHRLSASKESDVCLPTALNLLPLLLLARCQAY